MKKTFCDICGEELEDRSDTGSLYSDRPGEMSQQTIMEGDCYANGKRLKYKFIVSAEPIKDDICRSCVLEAIRYLANNYK